jgi:hypothetical protein
MSDRIRSCLLAVALLLAGGCYHYRVAFPNTAPAGTEPRTETKWSLVWGLVQQNIDDPPSCPTHHLAEVTATTNYLYALVTVATLGLAAPVQLQYRCAAPVSRDL